MFKLNGYPVSGLRNTDGMYTVQCLWYTDTDGMYTVQYLWYTDGIYTVQCIWYTDTDGMYTVQCLWYTDTDCMYTVQYLCYTDGMYTVSVSGTLTQSTQLHVYQVHMIIVIQTNCLNDSTLQCRTFDAQYRTDVVIAYHCKLWSTLHYTASLSWELQATLNACRSCIYL